MMTHLATIPRRWWAVLLLAALLGSLAAHWSALRQPTTADAFGQIQLPGGKRQRKISNKPETGPSGELRVEVTRLKDDRVLGKVVDDLHLVDSPAFLGFAPERPAGAADLAQQRQFAVQRLGSVVNAYVVDGTSIVRVEYSNGDPALAARVVNAVLDAFIADRYQSGYASGERTREFLSGRLADLRTEVNSTQMELLKLHQKFATPGYNPRDSQMAEDLASLTRETLTARLGSMASGMRLQELLQGDPEAGSDVRGDLTASAQESLQMRLARDGARRNALRIAASLGPSHPATLAAQRRAANLDEELRGAEGRMVDGGRAQQQLADSYSRQVESALRAEHVKVNRLAPDLRRYADLERQYVFARLLYFTYTEKLRWASVSAALKQSKIYIVDRAAVPVARPVTAGWRLQAEGVTLALALAALGVVWAGRRAAWWERVALWERLTGLPALATFPALRPSALAGLPELLAASEPQTAEARHARTAARTAARTEARTAAFAQGLFDLQHALNFGQTEARPRDPNAPAAGGQAILFTSATPGEGKTSISGGVARAMARRGVRVLLIDGDLHRPALGRRWRLAGRVGLTTVLSGNASLAEAVQPVAGTAGLDVLAGGPLAPRPGEMMGSGAMLRLLREAREQYGVVVIDAPPFHATNDALVLCPMVDRVVWVVSDRLPRRAALDHSRHVLTAAGAPLAGFVLNQVHRPELAGHSAVREWVAWLSGLGGRANSGVKDSARPAPVEAIPAVRLS